MVMTWGGGVSESPHMSDTSSLGFSLATRRVFAGLGITFGIITLLLGLVLVFLHTARCSRYASDPREEEEEEEEDTDTIELRPTSVTPVLFATKRD